MQDRGLIHCTERETAHAGMRNAFRTAIPAAALRTFWEHVRETFGVTELTKNSGSVRGSFRMFYAESLAWTHV